MARGRGIGVLLEEALPSHMAVGHTLAPGFELLTLALSIDFEPIKLNLTRKKTFFFERPRKGQPCPVMSYEKSRYYEANRRQAFPSLANDRVWAGRKTGEQARTAEHQRMENYQGSTVSWAPLISQSPGANYCGIIGSPQRPDELQALWAQRVSDQQAKARSTRLTEPKADGAPR